MLALNNVKKDYPVSANVAVHALKGITLNFRSSEFVAVLGPSGCGKTTLLNIIGGLDRYTSGSIVINGVNTSAFTDIDWDSYRNHFIGFVFQSYNLISHQSVLANVELALTITGLGKAERRKRALQALKDVGLENHVNKLPNQLSGGETQRVAIARAIVNNPEILLADEPTGALDSQTGEQIMDILKKISEKRLVIMVSHNRQLSERYATRIIDICDGVIQTDSSPFDGAVAEKAKSPKSRKKTSMGWLTAIQLSLKNLLSKRGRTMITAIAGSIGIIGVGLVLSVQYGMNVFMGDLSKEVLNKTPLSITSYTFTDVDAMQDKLNQNLGLEQFPKGDYLYPYKPLDISSFTVSSDITQEYVDHLNSLDPSTYSDMVMRYAFNWSIATKHYVDGQPSYKFATTSSIGWSKIPADDRSRVMYELIGSQSRYPSAVNELALVVDSYNRVDYSYLVAMGIQVDEELVAQNGKMDFNDILGATLKWVPHNAYFSSFEGENGNEAFKRSDTKLADLYESDECLELTVVGILRRVSLVGDTSNMAASFMSFMDEYMTASSVLYTQALEEYVISDMSNSDIVKALLKQRETGNYYDITSGSVLNSRLTKFSEADNLTQCKRYGALTLPSAVYIYPASFETKQAITAHLSAWNDAQESDATRIYWTDMEAAMSYITNTIDIVSIVLAVFAGISLVVSSVMIGVITYVSVVERTKEIGILRSLGASKRDIANVFNAETVLVGFFAGVIGVAVSALLTIPINAIINYFAQTSMGSLAVLNPITGVILVLVSMLLTLISGLVPSGIAARKDPVTALRTE